MFSGWGLSWGGWLDNRRGEWWLLAQILLICAHLLPAWPAPAVWGLAIWPRPLLVLGAVILLCGLVLALKAFLALGESLSPLPAPKHNNHLVITGPYSHCRHPLYQAILVSSFGMVIGLGSILHLVLMISLAVLLRSKAHREERSLIPLHPDYATYQATTPAIIPGVVGLDWRQ